MKHYNFLPKRIALKEREKIRAVKKSDKYFLNQVISSYQQQLIRLIICTFHIQRENNTTVVTVPETYYYNLTMNIPNEKHSTAMMTVFFTTVKVLKNRKKKISETVTLKWKPKRDDNQM